MVRQVYISPMGPMSPIRSPRPARHPARVWPMQSKHALLAPGF
jgi:hypothetical protein